MSDKDPTKTEENANQNTDSSWFYVENDQEGKDLLNARTWDVSRRIIDDSSSQGNLHYGSTTQKDLIQDIDKAPETAAALAAEEPGSDAPTLTDSPDYTQTEADASATLPEAPAPLSTEDREIFTAERITGKQEQEVDDHTLASASFIASDPTELPTDGGRKGVEQEIVKSQDNSTGVDEITAAPPTSTDQPPQAAVITGVGESVTEDDAIAVSGKLDITDANAGEAVFAPETVTGEYGAFTIDATGAWTYSLANDQGNVQGLAEGERGTDTFTVTSVDGTSHSLTIAITGTNDTAVITGTTTAMVTEDAGKGASGTLTIEDADSGQTYFQAGEVHGDFGTLKIDEKGTWSYALDNTNHEVQALGTGEKTEDVLVVKAADGTEQKIIVSITGTNDGPVVSAAAPPVIAATEDTNIVIRPAQLLANASDIDGDTLAVTNLHVTAGGTIPVTLKISGDHYDPKNIDDLVTGAPQFQVSINGHTVDVDGVNTFSVGAVRGQWEYFTVNVSADTVIESVTVRFVNDAYDSYDNDKDGKLYEDRNLIVDKINIGGQVADSGAFVGGVTLEAEKAYYDTPKATGYETMPWSGSLKFDVSQVAPSNYSPISANSDGTWTLRPGSNFNGTIQLGYDVVDGHGGTTAATTVINIAAVNDEAHISGTTIGTVVEDAAVKSAIGVLKVTDVDSGEAHFQAGEVHGDFGTLKIDEKGNWSYALDNNNQHVQALGAGEKTEDVLVVKAADGTAQKITVSISGTNDGPVVSSPALLAGGDEDTSVTFGIADLLETSSDVDKTDTMTVANVTVDPAQGSLADNGDGIYTLKPADNYNGQVTIHYDVTDGTETVAASSTIDLKAVNDNPVAVDDATPSIAFDLPKGGAIVSSGDDVTVVKGEIVAEGQTGSSVDKWTFHHNGGALTIDTLSESGKNFIDIDGDGAKDHIDLMVRLYDSDGKQIAVDDDSNLGNADGSTNDFFSHVQDSYVQIGNLPPGDYTLAIGSWDLGHQEVVDNHNNNADTGISYNHEQDIGPYQITFTGDISFIEDGPLTTDEDSALIIKAETLLANDTDVEGDSLAILAVSHEAVDAAGNVVGTAELDPNGNVVFTPGEALDALTDGESQKVSLSYTVSDGQGGTSTANATININGSDDRAVIGGTESGTVGEDQSLQTSGKLTIEDASDTAIAEQQSLPQEEGAPETSTLEDQGADFIEAAEPIAIGLTQSELPSNAVETSGLEDVNPSEASAMGSDNSINTGETTTGSGITEEQGVTPPDSPDQFLVTDAAVEDIPSMNEQAETAVETQNEVNDAGLAAQDSVICEPDDSPPATHYDTMT